MLNKNPYLIIVSGPTGSGKGSAPEKIQTLLNLNKKHTKIVIDDIIENNKHYKKGINKYLNSKNINTLLNNISNEDITFFNELYFETRKKINCKNNNKEYKSCDELNDEILDNAFNKSQNIVFETTGQIWSNWIFDMYAEHIKKYNYQIIFVYSIVNICELLDRNKNRTIKSFKKFIKNNKNPAPRLPDIRFNKYKKNLKEIVKMFKKHNSNCNNHNICARYIILDNTTKNKITKNTVLYDSFVDNDIEKGNKIINNYMIETRHNCNSKKNINKKSFTKKRNKRGKRTTRKIIF